MSISKFNLIKVFGIVKWQMVFVVDKTTNNPITHTHTQTHTVTRQCNCCLRICGMCQKFQRWQKDSLKRRHMCPSYMYVLLLWLAKD